MIDRLNAESAPGQHATVRYADCAARPKSKASAYWTSSMQLIVVSRFRTATRPATPPTRSSARNGVTISATVFSSTSLSESIVITTSPVASRKPASSAARLPRLLENRIKRTIEGNSLRSRCMWKYVSSREPSSTTMISSRSCG